LRQLSGKSKFAILEKFGNIFHHYKICRCAKLSSWFDKLTMTLFLFREMREMGSREMGSGLAITHFFAGTIMLIASEYFGSIGKR